MLMPDEGYIKYQAHWTPTAPFAYSTIANLNDCRQLLYDAGLIGAYPDGIGFGNISVRVQAGSDTFYISGSATGNIPALDERHYALVQNVNIDTNELWCSGPLVASSEAMSHAVIYQTCPWVGAVVHIHHLALWQQLLYKVPTTDAAAPYGSPEMANEIVRLLRESNLPAQKIFAMAGHREGIFTFGADLKEATQMALDRQAELIKNC